MADEKKGWYPGKFYSKYRRSSTTSRSASVDRPERGSDSWSDPQDDPREHSFVDIPASDLPTLDDSTAPTPIVLKSPYRVRVKIADQKYLRILQPRFAVRVGNVKITGIQDVPFERTFELQNITNDIKIEVKGQSSLGPGFADGVIYVPATALLSFSGTVLAPTPTWREIFPLYDKNRRCDDLSIHKLAVALPDVTGSGMSKAKFPLGFLLVEVEIIAPGGAALGLYLEPSSAPTNPSSDDDLAASEMTMIMQQAIVQRDVERLRSTMTRIPAIITAFLYFPEIAVLIAVFGCLCFSLNAGQLPFTAFFLLLTNGLLTSKARSYGSLTIWNDPGTPIGAPPTLEDISSMPSCAVALLKANAFVVGQLSLIVHELEVFHNVLTFADPRVSIISYCGLLLLTLFATLWLCVFSLASLVFVVGAAFFLLLTFTTFAQEQVAALSSNSVYLPVVRNLRMIRTKWEALRSRVPDELEMQHRYISTLAVTKESAAQMMDAAADFVASPPTSAGSSK